MITAWKICGRQADAITTSGVISGVRNTLSLPVCTLVADRKICMAPQARTLSKSISRSTTSRSGLRLSGFAT